MVEFNSWETIKVDKIEISIKIKKESWIIIKIKEIIWLFASITVITKEKGAIRGVS
jgi:hypothetical protein